MLPDMKSLCCKLVLFSMIELCDLSIFYFVIFSVMVVIARGILKKNKYFVEAVSDKLSNRTILLRILPVSANKQDVVDLFL